MFHTPQCAGNRAHQPERCGKLIPASVEGRSLAAASTAPNLPEELTTVSGQGEGPTVQMEINGKVYRDLIDSGATASVLREDIVPTPCRQTTKISLMDVQRHAVSIRGSAEIQIRLGEFTTQLYFCCSGHTVEPR